MICNKFNHAKVWKSKNKICNQTSTRFCIHSTLPKPADHFHFQIDMLKDSAKAESLIEENAVHFDDNLPIWELTSAKAFSQCVQQEVLQYGH